MSLFSPLSKLEKLGLIDVMGSAQYKEGDVICREGDIGNSMYIILEGEVKVMVDLNKKKDNEDEGGEASKKTTKNGVGKKKKQREKKRRQK